MSLFLLNKPLCQSRPNYRHLGASLRGFKEVRQFKECRRTASTLVGPIHTRPPHSHNGHLNSI